MSAMNWFRKQPVVSARLFLSKKEEFEKRLAKFETALDARKICHRCGGMFVENAVMFRVEHRFHASNGQAAGVDIALFCWNCKPDYDVVHFQDGQNPKFYRTEMVKVEVAR